MSKKVLKMRILRPRSYVPWGNLRNCGCGSMAQGGMKWMIRTREAWENGLHSRRRYVLAISPFRDCMVSGTDLIQIHVEPDETGGTDNKTTGSS